MKENSNLKKLKSIKAFTLIELLAVIVVLGIILAIAIPKVTETIKASKEASFKSSIKMAFKEIKSTVPLNNVTSGRLEDLELKNNYLEGNWSYDLSNNTATISNVIDTKYKLAIGGNITENDLDNKVVVEYKNAEINTPDNTITFNSVGLPLKDYKIYGNSTQLGTPTPSNPINITDTDTITVTSSGKNLFDMNFLENPSTVLQTIILNLKPNSNYTISTNMPNTFSVTNSAYLFIALPNESNSSVADGTSRTKKTGSDGILYIRYRNDNSINFSDYWVQLEEDMTATNYEPYQAPLTTTIDLTGHEPLRKVGDYADYIDFGRGKIIRKIYHEKITNVVEKSSLSRYGDYSIFLSEISKKPYISNSGNNTKGFCLSNKFLMHDNVYSSLTNDPGYIQTYITSNGNYRVAYSFNETTIDTIEEAQSVLNDGADVYYVLDETETIEEDINLPSIPTFSGNTTITVEGSKIAAKFYEKK